MKNNQHLGYVLSIRDTIANVSGLAEVTSGEMVIDIRGNVGLVLNLAKAWTGVVMFKDNVLMAGDTLSRLFTTLNISCDPVNSLSNVVDSLGFPLNHDNFLGAYSINVLAHEFGQMVRPVELKAPGIIVRQPVYEPLFTGLLGIDGLLPLGQGQRELIIGDRQTGKTAIAIDIILNQSNVDQAINKYILKKR